MTLETFWLVLRMLLALAVVLGLMWAAARLVRNVGGNRGLGVLELLARQQVGRTAAVAVVRVADRAIVVGVTDNKVSLLTEADLDAVEEAHARAEEEQKASRKAGPGGPLGGSILSPSTWKQAADAVRDRTARRG